MRNDGCNSILAVMSEERFESTLDERLADLRRRAGLGASTRCCSWHGCEERADFKAPADRQSLRDYVWFCLHHVREYNQRWDYFAGMSADEIECHRRADVTWHRPTWQFGTSRPEDTLQDPFNFFGETGAAPTGGEPPVDAKSRQMMQVLALENGYSEGELKARYKAMVKRYHPDLHGGDLAAEEKLKLINEAYAHLKLQFA